MAKKLCFIYQKEKDEFKEIDKNDIAEQYHTYLKESAEKLETYATSSGSDAVLLFNAESNNWTLVFAKGSGIVSQRNAQRKAESVRRTGVRISSGERIGVNAPMNIISTSNIGDLDKSVQTKYLLHSDLRGL